MRILNNSPIRRGAGALALGLGLGLTLTLAPAAAQDAAVATLQAARQDPHAGGAMMLAAANAGAAIVAVGEHGYVIRSEDGGASYRQAGRVPVDTTLTGVAFADAENGWAVGHGGVVIHSADGGRNWALQRQDSQVDQPLYSVYFKDARTGWAAGLWSLLLHTGDGGKTWSALKLPAAQGQKRADLNLLKVFGGAGGRVYIAAEQGTLFRSRDSGASWDVLQTGSKASLWAGTVSPAGTLIVGGLGGKLLRSADDGASWQALAAPGGASITGLLAQDGLISASTLDGKVLQSADDGVSWRVAASGRLPLTTLLAAGKGRLLGYSKEGPVALTSAGR